MRQADRQTGFSLAKITTTMNRNEAVSTAQAYVENHADYIRLFEPAWSQAIAKSGFVTISTNGVEHPKWEALTPEETIEIFQTFWEGLPDNSSIHKPGFNQLCDIAENIFGFDDEDPEIALQADDDAAETPDQTPQ